MSVPEILNTIAYYYTNSELLEKELFVKSYNRREYVIIDDVTYYYICGGYEKDMEKNNDGQYYKIKTDLDVNEILFNTTVKIPFLSKNFKISTRKIPAYIEFQRPFYDINTNNNIVTNNYLNYSSFNLGRFYKSVDSKSIVKNINYMELNKWIHNNNLIIPMFEKKVTIDMNKCYQTIMYEYCKNYKNVELEGVKYYIDNFEYICNMLQVQRKDVKEIFNSIILGRDTKSVINTCRTMSLKFKNSENANEYNNLILFAGLYVDDIDYIKKNIWRNARYILSKHHVNRKTLSTTNNKNTTIHYWFSCIENNILFHTYKWLLLKNFIQYNCCALQYDAIQFPSNEVISDQDLKELNEYVYSKTRFNMKFKVKYENIN